MKVSSFFTLTLILLATLQTAQAQADAEMIADWERAKAYTLEYLEAMPDESYSLKPTPELRSFAEQMLHLTDGNYGFASAALGLESPGGFGANEKAEDKSKTNVIKLVTAGYDFVIKGLKAADPDQMGETVTLFGRFEMTRLRAMEKAFEHQTHHRGQTTIYLRLAGATPPQEKLF